MSIARKNLAHFGMTPPLWVGDAREITGRYDAAVVEPIKNGSDFLWHGVDETVIDGTVNGSAGIVGWFSNHLRKLETGFVQNYALAILLGVVIVTGYLIGR